MAILQQRTISLRRSRQPATLTSRIWRVCRLRPFVAASTGQARHVAAESS